VWCTKFAFLLLRKDAENHAHFGARRLVQKDAVKDKTPQVCAVVHIQPLHLTLSKDMICHGTRLINSMSNSMSIQKARAPFLKLRPKVEGYRGNYRVWWKYAYQRAMDLVRVRRRDQSWDGVVKRIKAAVRYSKLYKRALGVLPLEPLSVEEQDELSQLQDSQPLRFLQLVSKATTDSMVAQVRVMLKKVALSPQPKKSFMSRIFSSSSVSLTVCVGGEHVELSGAQVAALRSLAGTTRKAAAENEQDLEMVSNNAYIKMSLQLTFAGLALEIVRVDDGTRSRLVHAFVKDVRASMSQRKQGFLATVSLDTAVIETSNAHKMFVLDASSPYSEPEQPMLEMMCDMQPLSDDADMAITINLLPVIWRLDHEFISDLVDWTGDLKESLSHTADAIAANASTRMSRLAHVGMARSGEFARLYAQPEMRVTLDVNVSAPKLMMPCLSSGFGNDELSIVVVNFGHFSIHTFRHNDGDRYAVTLEDVNVHLSSAAYDWQQLECALLTQPMSATLELDKPTLTRPELIMCLQVASIDVRVTKAHVLHALALQHMLAVLISSDVINEAARTKKKQQHTLLKRHHTGEYYKHTCRHV